MLHYNSIIQLNILSDTADFGGNLAITITMKQIQIFLLVGRGPLVKTQCIGTL